MKGDVLIEQLNQKINELESELKEYKRCAVVGGDGKPIGIGQTVYTPFLHGPCIVESINKACVGFSNQYEAAKAEYCYSTPDAVPGGDK